MSELFEARLKALEKEFETGKQMLAELETRASSLRGSLLRISGAIQVLREFVPQAEETAPAASHEHTEDSAVVTN